MVQDALLSCGTCGEAAAVHGMKYNKTGDYLICGRCYDKEHNKASAAVVDAVHDDLAELEVGFTPTKSVSTHRPTQTLGHLSYERASYLCNSCGYKFSRKKTAHFNGQCPYCSKRNVESLTPQLEQTNPETGGTKVFFDVDQLL